MGILDKVKYDIDTPTWRQMKPLPVAHVAGSQLCCDKRNSLQVERAIYEVGSATALYKHSIRYNGYGTAVNIGLTAFAAGGMSWFVPSFGIVGTIGAGSSTTKIVTSAATTLGAAISALAANQLITTDIDYSYKIRIIGSSAGGSGKIEERYINGNTASATPVIYLDEALSFTPASGDKFEIQSGIIYSLAGAASAAGQTRFLNLANQAVGNAGATGITTATAAAGVALDELYVPYDRKAGEGFLVGTSTYDIAGTLSTKGCLLATSSAANSITGQATGGDSIVLENEYRNFQIRIVEDTAIPTAVGQRAIIKSHTAGVSPVYTIGANWAVTPSTNAKFVIENPNCIILQSPATNTNLTYNFAPTAMNNGTVNLAANTWSATYFNAAKASPVAAGCMMFPSWGHEPKTQSDGTRISRHSYLWCFRGTSTALDLFDIAGGVAGTWSLAQTYSYPTTMAIGSSGDFDPVTFLGEYAYIVVGITQQLLQFNVANASLVPWTLLPAQAATAGTVGNRMCIMYHIPEKDSTPDDKLAMMYIQSNAAATLFRSDING